MNEMVDDARSIVEAVSVPVIADGEDGWFNAANILRTIRSFESAGLPQFTSKTTLGMELERTNAFPRANPTLASSGRACSRRRSGNQSCCR
jgi:hypothetical protein